MKTNIPEISEEGRARLEETFRQANLPRSLNSFPRRYAKALKGLEEGFRVLQLEEDALRCFESIAQSDLGIFNKDRAAEIGKIISKGLVALRTRAATINGKARAKRARRDNEKKFVSRKKKI
jgi:hypothetical protein